MGRHGEDRHSLGRGGKPPLGREGGKRLFGHGDIRYVLLTLLAEKPFYGYELIKAVEERVHGAYAPSPGIVYPTLTQLEELGYAASETNEEGKNLYSATTQGKAFLRVNKPIVEKIFAHMAHAAERHKQTENPQLVRAMENLKLALKLKSSSSELSTKQIQSIAGVLDRAAEEIEKC
jgi:DNA-binding PadR family transcriptional regulator